MSPKAVFIICAQALLFQSAFSQYVSRATLDASGFGAFGCGSIAPVFTYNGLATPFGFNGLAAPYAYNRVAAGYNGIASPWGYEGPYAYDSLDWARRSLSEVTTPTTSCRLIVTSSSPVPPTGISVISDTGFDGILAVAGDAPFVGTAGMEGVLATIGSGAISHACGKGVNAMVSETGVFTPSYATYGPGIAIAPSWAPATATIR